MSLPVPRLCQGANREIGPIQYHTACPLPAATRVERAALEGGPRGPPQPQLPLVGHQLCRAHLRQHRVRLIQLLAALRAALQHCRAEGRQGFRN